MKLKSKKKKIYIISSFLVITLAVLLLPRPASAAADWLIYGILGPIFMWIIDFLGGLLIALIQILIGVAQYNDFLDSPAVTKGWMVLRDIGNMFFILVLLVIAFATVLGSEKYNYKKYLFPMIYMAVLINFSKMIAGFFIDISQVIMLQFVNGFKYAAAGNLISSFGLKDLLAIRELDKAAAADMSSEVLVSLMLALAMLIVAVVVVGVIVVVFLLRIIALWILVILSPIAYVAHATPGGESYSGMWWSTFSKYLIAGPALAFFLWMSMAVMAINPANLTKTTNIKPTSGIEDVGAGSGTIASGVSVGIAKVGSSEHILSFAISIGLLIGALMATQKLGVAGSNIAMAAKGKLETAGKRFAKVGLGIGAVAGTPFGLAALGLAGAKVAGKGAQAAVKPGIPALGRKMDQGLMGLQRKVFKSEKPISFRPSVWKKAWEARSAKKEKERYSVASGKAQDVFENVLSLGKGQSREADRGIRSEEAEREKEILSSDADELVKDFDKAVGSKNRRDAVAIARKLFRQNDGNEILAKMGYETGLDGVQNFIDEKFKPLLGEQGAYRVGTDLSYLSEAGGWYNLARTYRYNDETGKFMKNDEEGQAKAVAQESNKMDPQMRARNFGRGTYVREADFAVEGEDRPARFDTGLSESGEGLIRADSGAQLNRVQPKTKATWMNHLDEVKELNGSMYKFLIEDAVKLGEKDFESFMDLASPRLVNLTQEQQAMYDEGDMEGLDASGLTKNNMKKLTYQDIVRLNNEKADFTEEDELTASDSGFQETRGQALTSVSNLDKGTGSFGDALSSTETALTDLTAKIEEIAQGPNASQSQKDNASQEVARIQKDLIAKINTARTGGAGFDKKENQKELIKEITEELNKYRMSTKTIAKAGESKKPEETDEERENRERMQQEMDDD
ncbi:DUF1542 domain-containing protein [Candidatus Falkowbacteria bacterium]|nr:DUF1542 domain-containing protein [Candidatus Falkowbacteria bacterium]